MHDVDFTLAFTRINWMVAFILLVVICFLAYRKDTKVIMLAGAALLVAAFFAGLGWF